MEFQLTAIKTKINSQYHQVELKLDNVQDLNQSSELKEEPSIKKKEEQSKHTNAENTRTQDNKLKRVSNIIKSTRFDSGDNI